MMCPSRKEKRRLDADQYMTKFMCHAMLLVVVLISFLSGPTAVSAAPLRDETVYSLTDLGAAGDLVLRGPYETTSVRFDLPPDWVLQDGVTLTFSISTYVNNGSSTTAAPATTGAATGALLDVFFNGRLQQSLALNTGEDLIYRVPVSANALASPYPDGSYHITFVLNAAYDCRLLGSHTTVKISGTSQAVLPHLEQTPTLDLHRLPWPIFQQRQSGVQVPETVPVVVPTAATASELNAALLVMGSFGRMTGRLLPMTLITTDALTPDNAKASDLIFVGKASDIAILSQISLPVPVAAGTYAGGEVHADDGILQMAASPWNNAKSLLIVSGNTDLGVLKAAQALSTGRIQTGSQPTYSVVEQVNPTTQAGLLRGSGSNQSAADYTLSDLGFQVNTTSGVGIGYFTYSFDVPSGLVPTAGASLDLNYSYSTLVDPNLSSADVTLNGERVGSISLAADHQNSANAHVPLPLSLMKPGRNTLEVVASLLPLDTCSAFSFNDLWMTIFSDSVLHLPLTPAVPTAFLLQDLKSYPRPFDNDPSLSTIAFVLPKNDPKAWSIAGDVAYDLGGQATGAVLNFETTYDGAMSDEVRSRNVILVGLPTELSIISELKDSLPGYFEQGSNLAIVKTPQVTYRVPANKALGYLELFVSPWNKERAVLTVLGTTANGVSSASHALIDGTVHDSLSGDFASVDGSQIIAIDTRTGLGIGRLTGDLVPSAQTQQERITAEAATQAAMRQRQIVLGGLVGILILMVVVLVIAVWLRRRGRTRSS
jgi:cellulose synthase subunit